MVAELREVEQLCQTQPQVRFEAAGPLGRPTFEQPTHCRIEMAVMPQGGGNQPVGKRPVAPIGNFFDGKRSEIGAGQHVG